VALAMSAWMVLEDQVRLQPWMYQFLLMGFALAACREDQAIGLCRLFVVAMYFHSGLSKLDSAFVTDMGYWFLFVASRWFGQDSQKWPDFWRNAAILAMPCWEIAVAVGLVVRLRRIAVIGAVVQHLALMAILGPWGLNHGAIVLTWNATLAIEVPLLFSKGRHEPEEPSPRRPLASLAKYGMLAVAILPLGEPLGFWDAWPSFALYASHVERVTIEIIPEERDRLPEPIRRYDQVLIAATTFEQIDLGRWSLGERRAPVYPSARALSGVAEAVASRYGDRLIKMVSVSPRADRLTGARRPVLLHDRSAIRRHGDTYWLNAHPARD
jgi:hypothetical protein